MADPIRISALPSALAAILAHIIPASNPDTDITEGVTVAQIAAILPSLLNPGAEQDVASASTIDLTAYTNTTRFRITGATGISAIDIGANKLALLRFAATPTVTHNATTLILPGGANITAAAGDVAMIVTDGSGNVRVIAWFRASGAAMSIVNAAVGLEQTVASAGTVNLTTNPSFQYVINGTTTITAFTLGAGKWALLRFAGALTLTHNATTLILPGGANITTAAGDVAMITTDGSGNVRVVGYWRANGTALTLPTATAGEIRTGSVTGKAVDPAGVHGSLAWVSLAAASAPPIDHSAGFNRFITLGQNTTFPAPSSVKNGMPFNLDITPGGFTTAWNGVFKFGAAGAPSITSRTIVHFMVDNSGNFICVGTSDPS